MNKGERRRSRRHYKIRYDRIIVFVLAIAALIVVVTSCTKACSEDPQSKPKKPTESSSEINGDELKVPDETKPDTGSQEQPTKPEESYTEIAVPHDDIYKGNLILVNADHEYTFPEGDTDLQTLYDHKNDYYNASDYVTKVDAETVEHINSMMEAFGTSIGSQVTGLYLLGGFLTFDEQSDKYHSGASRFEPGHSEYHSGRSFDIVIYTEEYGSRVFSTDAPYDWFKDNAGKYGFIVRFPEDSESYTGEEPRTNTYRYVGVPHSYYMSVKGICLEQYIDEVKKYTKDEPLIVEGDTYNYRVYYVPAEAEGDTMVPVPTEVRYTVSGNNVDGFIVTVTTNK